MGKRKHKKVTEKVRIFDVFLRAQTSYDAIAETVQKLRYMGYEAYVKDYPSRVVQAYTTRETLKSLKQNGWPIQSWSIVGEVARERRDNGYQRI